MSRISIVIAVSLPPLMAAELEATQFKERRSRSEIIREALRDYFSSRTNSDS
jgi:metal-responsive CopG/Arc/MetJ family transcriptional regulator